MRICSFEEQILSVGAQFGDRVLICRFCVSTRGADSDLRQVNMDSECRVVRAPSLDASYGFRVSMRCVNSSFQCVKKYLSLETDADFECCRRAAYVTSVGYECRKATKIPGVESRVSLALQLRCQGSESQRALWAPSLDARCNS